MGWKFHMPIGLAVAFIVVAPFLFGSFTITLMNYIGIYAFAVLGLVLLTGVGGLTSFGQAAFVGAIIGGLVSYPAAAAGAIFVGLLESYAAFWDSALKEVFVFSALIPILLWQSFTSASGIEEEIEEEEREGEA